MTNRKPRPVRCTTDSCQSLPEHRLTVNGEPYGGVVLCTRCLGDFGAVTIALTRQIGAGAASFEPINGPGTVQASLGLVIMAGR